MRRRVLLSERLSIISSFLKRNCFLPSADEIKYDKIHVGACCPDAMIQCLYDKLTVGGILVGPYGDRLIKAKKEQDEKMTITTLVEVRYSDLILPSNAEVKEALKEIEIAKANRIIVPPDQRIAQLAHMVNNKICSDILFDVQGRLIYAHKIVFAVQSPDFFQKIENQKLIKIEGYNSETFLSMLHFLYTGTFTAAPEYWNEILSLSVNYQLHNLEVTVKSKLSNQALPNVCSFDTEISNLIGNEKFSDIKFGVDGHVIPAHKLVVVAQSEHFRKMFAGSFRESQDNTIKIFDCTPEIFIEVLRFIYTGECEINEVNCFGVLEQANFFQLTRLTAMCEIFWYQHINAENAANVLEFATHFNASQLKQFALEYIFKNVHAVTESNSWKELDIDIISSVLIASVERAK